jgi:hypothetical protein
MIFIYLQIKEVFQTVVKKATNVAKKTTRKPKAK